MLRIYDSTPIHHLMENHPKGFSEKVRVMWSTSRPTIRRFLFEMELVKTLGAKKIKVPPHTTV